MLLSKKIRLLPTPEQEILFWKHAGASRWAYNYFIAENQRVYSEYLENSKQGKRFLSSNKVKKQITQLLKPTTHTWLRELSSQTIAWAVNNAEVSYKKFLSGKSGRPKFKSRKTSIPSFYVRYDTLCKRNIGFHGERLGIVKTSEPLPKLPKGSHYSDPHISFDGKYWYLAFSYEVPKRGSVLTDTSLGIDLGVKDLAICSSGKKYKNINKSKTVKRLKKRLKHEERKLSRKLESNIEGYQSIGNKRFPRFEKPLEDCKNFQKQKRGALHEL